MPRPAYRGAEGMLDAHIFGWVPEGEPLEPWPENQREHLEHQLGRACMTGEIDAEKAMQALDDYDDWIAAGQPKLTTLPGDFIFM